MQFPFTKKQRIAARKLGCSCFNKNGGNVEVAYAEAKQRKSELGSVILVFTLGVLLLQGIYYAMKIWQSMNYSKAPTLPVSGEGFGLGVGEPYALSIMERKAMEVDCDK